MFLPFVIIYQLLDTKDWAIHKGGNTKPLTYETVEGAQYEAERLTADFKNHEIPIRCHILKHEWSAPKV
jgi:hypothetical protein